MLNKLEGFDYGTRGNDEEKEFRYVPRTIESVENTEKGLDDQFDILISSLSPNTQGPDKGKLLMEAGKRIGRYLQVAAETEGRGSLDIEGEVRAMAAFQGFLERELLKRGVKFIHLFREPLLLRGINDAAPFVHAERINEMMRGAQATVHYVTSLESDPALLFVGSEVGLDCRHAIDLVIGRGEGGVIKQIDLVQVKNSMPSSDEIAMIRMKHKAYAEALLNFEASAVDTDENNKRLDAMSQYSPESFKDKMAELSNFYNNLKGLNLTLEPTWESLVAAADTYSSDPVLFYIRLKSINETRLALVPQKFMQNMLMMVKEKVDQIELPQAVMAAYNRIIRGPYHIASAEEVYSVIVADGKEIQRLRLTR